MGWSIHRLNQTTINQSPRSCHVYRPRYARWRGEIRLTALEVIPTIHALVGLSEPRVPEDPTGGVTLIAPGIPLPLGWITLLWGLAGAVGERSTHSATFLVGGFTNTLPLRRCVTVRTLETTRVILGANRLRVIRVVAVLSALCYLQTRGTEGEILCQSSR